MKKKHNYKKRDRQSAGGRFPHPGRKFSKLRASVDFPHTKAIKKRKFSKSELP
jgi:hypothetical protein